MTQKNIAFKIDAQLHQDLKEVVDLKNTTINGFLKSKILELVEENKEYVQKRREIKEQYIS